MRDWRLEAVKKKRGTPSRLGLKPFIISNLTAEYQRPPFDIGRCTYWIAVRVRIDHPSIYIICIFDNKVFSSDEQEWNNGVCKGNDEIERKHGKHVYPCPIIPWTPPDYTDDEDSDESEY